MKVNQIYSTLNSVAKQMWGENALTVVDDRDVISMGKLVLSSDVEKDNFLGVLTDRIGKTIIRTLDLELEFPKLLRNSFEWGAILQKISIQPIPVKEQRAYMVGENDFVPNQFAIDKPSVSQKFFTDSDAWEFDLSIPDRLLSTAFLNAEAFGAFIDGIMSALNDSMTMSLNNMAHMAINNLIAEKLKSGNAVINVLKDYNTKAGTSYTSLEEEMDDKEFYRYTGMVIRNVLKYMSKPSKLYNTEGMVRATARDNANVFMSSDVWSGYTTYLSADTFHDELVNLDGFVEFTTLQATGVNDVPNVTNNTKINVIPASNADNDNTEVIGKGIICLITDREAIGIGYEDMFRAVDRNNRNRYTNYTAGACMQYYNDMGENSCLICAHTDGISVNRSTITFANPSADTVTITATTSPVGKTVTWKTSDSDVATVSSGVVTPIGKGSCLITAEVVIDGVKYIGTTSVTVTANS